MMNLVVYFAGVECQIELRDHLAKYTPISLEHGACYARIGKVQEIKKNLEQTGCD